MMVDTRDHIELLSNSNKNLDALNLQIQKARMSDEPVLVEYFQGLKDIILKRYKEEMLELCSKPSKFVNERGQLYYE